MAKYMILYNSIVSARDTMANANPEQMKVSMEEWKQWRDEASKVVTFEFGMPLQPVSRVTPEGVTEVDSQVSGYSTIESDSKEAVIEVLKNHPQLKRSGATIDVLEMLSMPGM